MQLSSALSNCKEKHSTTLWHMTQTAVATRVCAAEELDGLFPCCECVGGLVPSKCDLHMHRIYWMQEVTSSLSAPTAYSWIICLWKGFYFYNVNGFSGITVLLTFQKFVFIGDSYDLFLFFVLMNLRDQNGRKMPISAAPATIKHEELLFFLHSCSYITPALKPQME